MSKGHLTLTYGAKYKSLHNTSYATKPIHVSRQFLELPFLVKPLKGHGVRIETMGFVLPMPNNNLGIHYSQWKGETHMQHYHNAQVFMYHAHYTLLYNTTCSGGMNRLHSLAEGGFHTERFIRLSC